MSRHTPGTLLQTCMYMAVIVGVAIGLNRSSGVYWLLAVALWTGRGRVSPGSTRRACAWSRRERRCPPAPGGPPTPGGLRCPGPDPVGVVPVGALER